MPLRYLPVRAAHTHACEFAHTLLFVDTAPRTGSRAVRVRAGRCPPENRRDRHCRNIVVPVGRFAPRNRACFPRSNDSFFFPPRAKQSKRSDRKHSPGAFLFCRVPSARVCHFSVRVFDRANPFARIVGGKST